MATKACSVCGAGQMEKLNHIERHDKPVTTYWRCPICSQVRVARTPAQLNRNQKPKRGGARYLGGKR